MLRTDLLLSWEHLFAEDQPVLSVTEDTCYWVWLKYVAKIHGINI